MRLAAYCRVSTDHGEQLDSLENQKCFFQDFARLHHHELIRIYADEGISGKQLKKRDRFLQMLEDAKQGEFDAVAVKDIARFARNTLDFLTAIRILKRYGVVVLFVTNNMTTYGDSEFTLTIFGAIAQEESINTSKRVRFGKKINAQKGRVPNLVYGYVRQNLFTLQVDEGEAAVVRRVFQMVLDGYSMRRIASTLNAERIPTKKGCLWEERNLLRLLHNPLYKGVVVNHKSETRDVLEGTRMELPPEEWYSHIRPEYAIVDTAQFDAVQEELARRKAMHERETAAPPPRRHSSAHLFSNLLVCHACGAGFSRKRYRRKDGTREFWVCRKRDQGIAVTGGERCTNCSHVDEPALCAFLSAYFLQAIPDLGRFLERAGQEYSSRRKTGVQADSRRKWLHAESKRLRMARERLLTLYTNGLVSLEELKQRSAQNEAQRVQVEKELSGLEDDGHAGKMQSAWIRETALSVLSLEGMTNAGLRQVVGRIEIAAGEHARLFLHGIEGAVAEERSGALNRYRRKRRG